MNTARINKTFVAIALGTFALFAWGGLSHMVLLIGTGFNTLPNEEIVLTTLKKNISEEGLYFFPGKDFNNHGEEEESRWTQKFKSGPAGILVYRPVGGDPFSASKLLIQFASTLLSVLMAVYLVSQISAGYWRRVASVTLLGFVACTAVSTIYWNWYAFPTSFFLAQIIDIVVGFFIVGLIVSKLAPHKISTPDAEQH